MSSRIHTLMAGLALVVSQLLSSPLHAEEITDQWRWATEMLEGDRKLSHSFTLYNRGGTFEGHAGKSCTIAGGREKEIPLEKVEFDRLTRKVSFMMFFDEPLSEDGTRRTYDAKFEGSLGDRHIVGVITYINADECLRPVEGNVTMTYMDTGVKSDLVKEIIPPTANVKGRYDIRIIGRPQVSDLNNDKAWIGGRGHAFIGGAKAHFMDHKNPSQIEVDFVGKAFHTFKACAPIAREGAADTAKGVIQIIGDGKMVKKPTKNPKNPVGLFTIKTLTRCREVASDRKAFN